MGGKLVCEFAYIRQGETESDEVNRFPFGQTHVGFAKLYPCISSVYSDKKSSSPDVIYILRCLAATEKSSSPGDCIRVANGKLQGRQYYSLTALIPVDGVSRNSGRCITTLRAVPRITPNNKTRRVSLRTGQNTTNKSYYQGKRLPIVLPIEVP